MAKAAFFAPISHGRRVTARAEPAGRGARQLADADRPAAHQRAASAGSRRSGNGRAPHRPAAAEPHHLAHRRTRGSAVAAGPATRHPPRRECRPHGVRVGAAHCRRQRRQHPAGARRFTNAGDRDSPFGRRHARPADSATDHRERDCRARRRGVRLTPLLVVVPGADSITARSHPGRGCDEGRHRTRSHGTGVRARFDGADRAGLRTRPGASGVDRRCPRGREAGRAERPADAAGCAARWSAHRLPCARCC